MKTFKSPRLKPGQWSSIEDQLVEIFREILFRPVVDVVEDASAQGRGVLKLDNSDQTVLLSAMRTGKIQYGAGVFSGKFSSQTSKALRAIGAKFSKQRGEYLLDPALVPAWVKAESGAYMIVAKTVHAEIGRRLDEVQKNLDSLVDQNTVDPSKMIDSVSGDFRQAAKLLQVQPELSPQSREKLAEDYTDNMKLWIKKWCEEEITELREQVEDNALEGYRFDRLIDRIRSRYGVTESKAKFLARQETSLFVSKHRQQRYGEAGVVKYIWSTSHDERVRESHKHLDKKEFFYSQPPVVATIPKMRTANPGEDFNCRCVDIPILP